MKRALVLPAALLLPWLAACGGDDGPDVRVADVVRGDVQEVVDAPGTITARASSAVTSPAAGTVAALLVRDGQSVVAGQKLLRISSPSALQALGQARRAVAAAEQRVQLPSADLGPLQDQLDSAAATAFRSARQAAALVPDAATRARLLADVAAAQARYDATAAAARSVAGTVGAGVDGVEDALNAVGGGQRVQAQALLASAQATVDALVVRAPQAGVVSLGDGTPDAPDTSALLDQLPAAVTSQLGSAGGTSSTQTAIRTGATITQGQDLLTVTDTRGLGVTADVDETDVLLVRAGVAAGVELDAVPDVTYDARVQSVDVAPSQGTGGGVTYRVRMSLALPLGAPRPLPGMSAVVDLRVRDARQVITVPSAAVVRDGARDAVFVLADGAYRTRPITVGTRGEDAVEVRTGLVVGDRVVVTNADQVRDGQRA